MQPVIGRVSERRMDYLTACFRQAGLNRTEAQHRARLAYAAYVGFLQLNLQLHQARLQHDEFEAYVEHVMATLIPAMSRCRRRASDFAFGLESSRECHPQDSSAPPHRAVTARRAERLGGGSRCADPARRDPLVRRQRRAKTPH